MHVCNGCHDLLLMFINIDDIATLNINSVNYCCTINEINKSEDLNLLQNIDLTIEVGH